MPELGMISAAAMNARGQMEVARVPLPSKRTVSRPGMSWQVRCDQYPMLIAGDTIIYTWSNERSERLETSTYEWEFVREWWGI